MTCTARFRWTFGLTIGLFLAVSVVCSAMAGISRSTGPRSVQHAAGVAVAVAPTPVPSATGDGFSWG